MHHILLLLRAKIILVAQHPGGTTVQTYNASKQKTKKNYEQNPQNEQIRTKSRIKNQKISISMLSNDTNSKKIHFVFQKSEQLLYFLPLVFPRTLVADYSSYTLVEDEVAFLPHSFHKSWNALFFPSPKHAGVKIFRDEGYIFIRFLFMFRSVWKCETDLCVIVFTS